MIKRKDFIGDLFVIDLGLGEFAFGMKVNKEETVFFTFKSSELTAGVFDQAYSSPVAFRVPVMNSILKSGRWKIVDSGRPVDAELSKPAKYFIQDPISGSFSLYCNGDISPCSRDEVINLERAAAWEAEHVEDRLRDYFFGRPNSIVETMKPK